MFRAILLVCLLAVTYAADDCTIPNYAGQPIFSAQDKAAAGTAKHGDKVVVTVADKYMCLNAAAGEKATITCNDGCMKTPPCKKTTCTSQTIPTDWEKDGAECTGEVDTGTKCKIKTNNANLGIYTATTKDGIITYVEASKEILCTNGVWSHTWTSLEKKKCSNLAAATGKYDALATDKNFGEKADVTSKDGYTCGQAVCGYNGVYMAPTCTVSKCATAAAMTNVKTTPDCAGNLKTSAGGKCTVTAADKYTHVTTVTTTAYNALTNVKADTTFVRADVGSTFDYLCTAKSGWTDFVNTNDGKGNSVSSSVTRVSTSCKGAAAGTGYTVKTCPDGDKGADCTFEVVADYTCDTLASKCAFDPLMGGFIFKTPSCKWTTGCDVPIMMVGFTSNCAAGSRVKKDASCTFTNADTDLWKCDNMESIKCTGTSWEKSPSCTSTGKGNTEVGVCFQLSVMAVTSDKTLGKLKSASETKIKAVAGKPEDYTVNPPIVQGAMGPVDGLNAVYGMGTNSNANAVCMSVSKLTVAQAATLVASFKTSTTEYTEAIDNTLCSYHFGRLDQEKSIGGVYYPRVSIDGKLDVPILLGFGGVAGSASITSASTWVMGVLASFLLLGMTR